MTLDAAVVDRYLGRIGLRRSEASPRIAVAPPAPVAQRASAPSSCSSPPPPPTAIGLIAGGGRLPILVAEGLREAGHPD